MKRKILWITIAVLVVVACVLAVLLWPKGPATCKHQMTAHPATAATCTEKGNSEYWQCTKCNKLFADENGKREISQENTVVAEKGHSWGQWQVETATCTKHSEFRTCSVCNLKETREIPVNHHEVILKGVAPTCTETGLTEGKKCSVCDEILVEQQEIAALGHTEVVVPAVEATCTEKGLTEGKKCSVCNEILVEQQEIAALGHTEVVIAAVAPTCTETGLTEGKKCSVCNEILVEQQEIAAKGHSWGEWTVATAATCTSEGSEKRVCSACNQQETRTTEKRPHSEVTISAKEPTCTEAGLTEGKKCSVCETVLVAQQEVAALGHNWQWVVDKQPTEAEQGLKHEQCTRCDATRSENTPIEKLAHTHAMTKVAAVEPTCTTDGNKEYWKCSGCNKYFGDEQAQTEITLESTIIAALGHNWQWVVDKQPTETEQGLKHEKCTRCDATRSENTPIEKLEHTHTLSKTDAVNATCTTDGNKEYWKCSGCNKYFGDEQAQTEITLESTIIAALGHNWQWVVDRQPTETEQGLKHEQCARCDEKRNENTPIEKLTHTHAMTKVAAVEPTCTTDGNKEYWKCSGCNKYYSDEQCTAEITQASTIVVAKGHTWGDWKVVSAATCQAGGSEERVCSGCNEKETNTTEKLPHSGVKVPAVEPTCTTDGNIQYWKCSGCNKYYSDEQCTTEITVKDTVVAKGHNFVDGVCTRCGEKLTSSGLVFTLNSDSASYSVTGIGTCTDTDVVIPATYNGKPVTAIGSGAFKGCSGLTSISIPDSVTSIGEKAFSSCSRLTSITIPNSVTSIGEKAFSSCKSLSSVTLSNSITSISPSTFSSCESLTCINIPDGVTSIGNSAFYSCKYLTSITISNSVTSIGNEAFRDCTRLKSVRIGDNSKLTSIGSNAFYNCSSLTSITIPESVTTIGDYAFASCSKLTIYCEAASQPSGWSSNWNPTYCDVVWGYTEQ